MLQPHSPNSVAQLCKEIVPEGSADERGAQRVVLGYVLEDQSEGTPASRMRRGEALSGSIAAPPTSSAEGAPPPNLPPQSLDIAEAPPSRGSRGARSLMGGFYPAAPLAALNFVSPPRPPGAPPGESCIHILM